MDMNLERSRSILVFLCSVAVATTLSAAPTTFVYVSIAGDETIARWELDVATGKLSKRRNTKTAGEPGALAIHPDRRFIFACIRSRGRLASFRADAKSGELAPISDIAAAADPAYVATDRTGRFLLTAYYVAGKVAVHPIGKDGSLDAATARWVTTADKAHAIMPDHTNCFVFVPHTGPNAIFQFKFDARRGKLVPNEPLRVNTGTRTGPRQFVIHPNNKYAYFDNEQGSSVTAFQLDKDKGTLTKIHTLPTLPAEFTGGNSCARIEGTRSGRFIYAANRGHDSIAGFEVDADTGRLKSLGQTPTEKTPRGFGIDPSGKILVAAGQNSRSLAVYRIDGRTGKLTRVGTEAEVGKRPWWVMLVRLGG